MYRRLTIIVIMLIAALGLAATTWAARLTVRISANPAIVFSGSSSTLTWSSTYATSASINQGIGSVPVNGSLSVSPNRTTTYTITVRNSSGYRTASARVTVKSPLPTISFSANPDTIGQGQNSTLSWTTQNASSASINQGIGTVALNGSKTVSPATTTTYVITVSGGGGTITANATVTVNAEPTPTASLTANPVSICQGQSSLLSWTSANATSLIISNGVGSVALNGSTTVSPALTTIYTLTANGPGGIVTASAQINVGNCPAPTATLTANPQTILPGESTTLSWTTANADSVTLDNGIGAIELNGSLTLSPSATTTFTLVATGSGGSQSFSTIVVVSSGKKCYAFIPDLTDKTVRIIDTDSNSLFKTITVAGNETSLQGVAAEESGVFVYVTDAGPTRLLRIDPLTQAVANELSLDANFQGKPKHAAAAADGTYIYTTSSVPLWDPDAGKWVGHICAVNTSGNGLSPIRLVTTPLPYQVSLGGLVVSRDGTRLFVADPENLRILVLDTTKLHRWSANPVAMSDELVAAISLSHPPVELAISPDGQMLYAISSSDLVEIDATQFTVSRSLALTGALFLQASPDGSRVFVMSSKSLTTVETAGFSKLSTVVITGMGTCSGFDVHPDGIRLFIVDRSGKKLFMVHAADGRVISTLALGSAPVAIGKFICPLPVTIAGNVKQDGNPLAGATMTLGGEGIARSKLTQVAGDFIFALKPGTYSLAPTFSNLAFSPESMDLQVSESLTGLDFVVSGVVPPPTVSLSAAKTWVKPYEDFTLTWDSTGADYVRIAEATSDRLPPSGSRSFALVSTATFTAVAYNRGGTTTSPGITVYVDSMNPPTASISANPSAILQGGSATLTWSTTRAVTVSIDNGIGTVAASGSKVVSPAVTTTYTITAKHSNGYQVTASATITVSEFDTSAKLVGTVTDFSTGQPIANVSVSATDASGTPKTAPTDATGKYTITDLRVGSVAVSFAKTGYDAYQQTIQIPTNTTFALTTKLHATLVGATLKGLVKDGLTNLPLVGSTVTATYSGISLTSTSAADGSYVIAGIPLGVSVQIAATFPDYQVSSMDQSFSQISTYTWDFVLYSNSAIASVNGKIINAKTLLPEAGVEVTHEASNMSKTTGADGTFTFEGIPFGEQTFYFIKNGLIGETYTCDVDHTPFAIDLIKPSSEGGQITVGQNISGMIMDSITQLPIAGAKVRIPGLDMESISDADGKYSLDNLPIGTYPMIILGLNHQALSVMLSVVIDETNTADFALLTLAKGLINGVITDAETGNPVAYASIEIGDSLSTSSEYDGTYKLVGVPPGIYTISIGHEEYTETSVANVEVIDLTPTTVNIQLNKSPHTGMLTGKILDIQTGDPIAGASVVVSGTTVSATTDIDGSYSLSNVPAGLNRIVVSAPGYPQSSRLRAVIADQSPSSPTTSTSDISIDANSAYVNEAVTMLIRANEGGDITSKDGRFSLHIFPDTLSADANITLSNVADGPNVPIGADMPMDPALAISGVKASSVMTRILIAPLNENDPVPAINGLAAVAMKYSQKDAEDFQLDEGTAFPYFWNGTVFSVLNPRPYEIALDRTNNIVYAVMDFTKTATGSPSSFIQSASTAHQAADVQASTASIIIAVGQYPLLYVLNRPRVNIYDKNELDCVTSASFNQIPNPNALPLFFMHGFSPFDTVWPFGPNPNKNSQYSLMLQDIVEATNGVYRPVFVSFNTRAKIDDIGGKLAEKVFGEYLDKEIMIKGLPSDSGNPDSGTFPYLDTIGYSMGGLVSRSFLNKSKVNKVHNMTMIATPNHGTFSLLNYMTQLPHFWLSFHAIGKLNPGARDMLDYDDFSSIGRLQNPFLYKLNSPANSRAVMPRGDIRLFAGNKETGYGIIGPFIRGHLKSPNDSLVPVCSVYCRPSLAPESNLSLMMANEPKGRKYEIPPKDFTHDNIGEKEYQLKKFITEITPGFSDWIVGREYYENPLDNAFHPPTATEWGYCNGKVKVEYNVWKPDAERQARDYDRVVLVIYHKDGNGKWHISAPKGGENGADSNGNVIETKAKKVEGNSSTNSIGAHILSASVNYEPNADNKLEGDVVDTACLVIPLKPGKMTVPLDPTKVQFRIPKLNE